MILDEKTIAKIQAKSGLEFNKVKDFVALADMILKATGRNIGTTTLKRLMGNISDTHKANLFTLDTIAQYLGFKHWNDYNNQLNNDSLWNYNDDTVYVISLSVGQTIEVQYLNRIICMSVITYKGQNALQVFYSKNSSLKKGDVLILHHLRIGEYLEAEQVIRDSKKGNYKTRGTITAIKIK